MIKTDDLPNQQPEEKIIYTLRRHWIVPLKIFLFFLLLAAIPLTFYLLAKFGAIPNLLKQPVAGPLITVGMLCYYLFIWQFSFQQFIDYYLDTWFVTTDRIVNIEQKGLFARIISENKLYRIQDVTAESKGFLATLFKYGNIYIQTAGEEQRSTFKQIPDPMKVSVSINKLIERNKKLHSKEIEKSGQ